MKGGSRRASAEECDACPESQDMVHKMQAAAQAAAASSSSSSSSSFSSSFSSPSPEDVGRWGWSFLHTLAASYPERADEAQQRSAMALMRAVGVLYPCPPCREDWAEAVTERPPQVAGRAELEQWLCGEHNRVNERLGKAVFDCATAHERWAPKRRH